MLVAREAGILSRIPESLRRFCSEVPQDRIREVLETRDPSYLASSSAEKGCLNSALFCEELAGYLLAQFPGRFLLSELSPVDRIVTGDDHLSLRVGPFSVKAGHAVLCTNGFTGYLVTDPSGQVLVDPGSWCGHRGCMSGYSQRNEGEPAAIRYYRRAPSTIRNPTTT